MSNRFFIDVREPYEFSRGHVKGAINLPPAELLNGAKPLQNISKDAELILYCMSGARSNASMHYLSQMGYTNLVNGINQAQVKNTYDV